MQVFDKIPLFGIGRERFSSEIIEILLASDQIDRALILASKKNDKNTASYDEQSSRAFFRIVTKLAEKGEIERALSFVLKLQNVAGFHLMVVKSTITRFTLSEI